MIPPDVTVIGAGAAGLATAIFTKRLAPDARVVLLDGAKSPGAKILVSGGSRCNVTNVEVTERDFNGGRPAIVRQVLRALPVRETVAFFAELGVSLHEEPNGKLFPDSNRSRDVLDALLAEVRRLGVELRSGTRVREITRRDGGFELATSAGAIDTTHVVLAAGGLSLPKTGSDGWGFDAARRLGHTIVPTTPALVPLIVGGTQRAFCAALSGVSLPARLDLWVNGRVSRAVHGSLLWTHFGISGPVALDLSRHWLRARLDAGTDVRVTASWCPADTFEALEAQLLMVVRVSPKARLHTAIATRIPESMAEALLEGLAIDGDTALAELSRDERRRVIHALIASPIAIDDSRGYSYAEVTAGGVALPEIDPRSMASRVCTGLYLVGEILDVDGRLGGFNFQWAWSSARVAAQGLARALAST